MNKKPVTMKDIALKAGVSVTTVSHVISKTRNVAQETRELVLRTLEELDYQQAESRQSQKKPALDRIGVITADIQEDYYILLVKTIETIASENNISVLFCDSEDDEEKEARNIAMMLNKNVDGLIIAPVGFAPYPRQLKAADVPVVLVDRQYDKHTPPSSASTMPTVPPRARHIWSIRDAPGLASSAIPKPCTPCSNASSATNLVCCSICRAQSPAYCTSSTARKIHST